jgi:DNA-binding transcriptional LysR family regulator
MTDLEWSTLQSFLAVVRSGRLTVAARQLGIDHSTLSRRITKLESSLDVRLFDRGPGGYSMTSHGERLLEMAQSMESTALNIISELSGTSLRVAGMLRIGAPDGFGTLFLAPRLARLGLLHPALHLQLVTMPRVFSLSKREADIAIGLARPEEGRLHARKLTDYELGLYASPTYLAQHSEPQTLSALREHRCIGYIDEMIYMPELDYLPLISRDLRPGFTSTNLIAQFGATVAGGGLCVLPCFMADGEPGLRRVLQDLVILRRSFWLIIHSDMLNLARVRTVADFIAEEVRAERKHFLPTTAEPRPGG